MAIYNIVLLLQHGHLTYSFEKENKIEMTIVYHLEVLQQRFHLSTFDKNLIKNLDETYFTIKINNDCTLGFCEDNYVKIF